MPETPRLTVALPTCNGAAHLREALAGLRVQGDLAFDILICDDRSEDESVAIARSELGDGASIVLNPERLGLAGNWNACVERSRTEWVAIFHQDDMMRPGHLAEHLRLIDLDPDARLGLVAGPVAMIDAKGHPLSRRTVDPGGLRPFIDRSHRQVATEVLFPPGEWVAALASSNPFRCSAVTTRKAAHQEVGGFDPSYRYAVDWDFWARVAAAWGLAWSLKPPTVAMRWHPASETHRFRFGTLDLDEQERLLEDLRRNHPLGADVRRAADDRLGRAFLNRAQTSLRGGDSVLARICLARAMRLSPRVLGRIAADPRLAVQMGSLWLIPGLAGRIFGRPGD